MKAPPARAGADARALRRKDGTRLFSQPAMAPAQGIAANSLAPGSNGLPGDAPAPENGKARR